MDVGASMRMWACESIVGLWLETLGVVSVEAMSRGDANDGGGDDAGMCL